jgi:4-hydroxymandelate oxidase
VVSNHGARQLDSVARHDHRASRDRGGRRRPDPGRVWTAAFGGGPTVFKALAFGAAAVMVGRPICWGLTVGGEDGVFDILRILREELENTMSLAGTHALSDITSVFVAPA